jgi:hypothetical protein
MDRARAQLSTWAREIGFAGPEVLFQYEAERRALALGPERLRHVGECLAGADRRLVLVGRAVDPQAAIVTTTLLRDAALLLLDASATARHAASAEGGADGAPGDSAAATGSTDPLVPPAEELHRVCEELGVGREDCARAERLLAATEPAALDALPTDVLARAVRTLEPIARSLRARLDARSVERIATTRWTRLSLVLLVLVAIPFFALRALATPPNVAFEKPVTLSTLDVAGAPERALVDGVRSGEVGPSLPKPDVVLTQPGPLPFAVIDLKGTYAIREIRVYNRDDGHHDETLPYAIDVSLDGHTFEPQAERSVHFGSWWLDPPWRVRLPKVQARYVRVRATQYLALSEVEVFAW